MGEARWMSPAHTVGEERDAPGGGTIHRSVPGIRSAKIFGGHIRGLLTDEQIAKYAREGFYETRHANFKMERAQKRLVWDGEKQDFVLR